jgi:3-mercaptopyruvate sulfurtransferase SseA
VSKAGMQDDCIAPHGGSFCFTWSDMLHNCNPSHADRNPKAEFQEERIKGAQFFDVDMIADTQSGLPHMLPTEAAFAAAADALGITNGSQVKSSHN